MSNRSKTVEVIDLPLDDVDDTQEWNLLLDKQYYSSTCVHMLFVKLIRKKEKDMYFDFTDYDKANKTNGISLLRDLLYQSFKADYDQQVV